MTGQPGPQKPSGKKRLPQTGFYQRKEEEDVKKFNERRAGWKTSDQLQR